MAREKFNFTPIDTTKLTGKLKTAWDNYVAQREPINEQIKKLQAKLEPHRSAVEKLVTAALIEKGEMTADQTAKFGFNWGGMAVAFTDTEAAAKRKRISL